MQPSILQDEILQQPQVIRQFLERESENVARLASSLRGNFEYVVIAARGTSDNAARYAAYLLGAHNRLQVALATPSLYTVYRHPPSLKHALVIGISQSGQSPDIVSVLDEGKRQGRPTVAITNVETSPLALAADHVIPLHAGAEQATAATKTYTASLAAIALLSVCLAEDEAMRADLKQLPDQMSAALTGLEFLHTRAERYRYMTSCVVIGRGFNYATAFEVALKLKELTGVVAEPYSSADFLHGPIAMVGAGFPVFVIAPTGAVLSDMKTLVARVKELGAECLVASDDEELLAAAQLPMPLPRVAEWLSPMVSVLPGQLFGLALARSRGLDPDHLRGITKVTETW